MEHQAIASHLVKDINIEKAPTFQITKTIKGKLVPSQHGSL